MASQLPTPPHLEAAAATPPQAPAQPEASGHPRAAHIHVVDDHELSRKHLRTVLSFHGYQVSVSDGAAPAHGALLAHPPDLVLLDLQMPGENGYELLAWMRQQPSLARVPAICVTASVPNSEREKVQAAGFVAFVPKPITPPQRLLDSVRVALKQP